MRIIRKRACARAGLLGNPSDGYNGKTISVIVRNFFAEVTLYDWEFIEIRPSQEDHGRFSSIHELLHDVELHGYYGGVRLIKATIKRFAEFCAQRHAAGDPGFELGNETFSIRYTTNIPRQVGMAGSSAIIVATLRALMEFYGVRIPLRVLPSLALSVERNELGIAAGLQDRVIQVYEGVVYMDFSRERMEEVCGLQCGHYEPLDADLLPQYQQLQDRQTPCSHYEPLDADLLPPLYIAYTRDRSEPTEVLHNPLRARYDQGDQAVIGAMRDFADLAAEGRTALLAGDKEKLSELMDRNFNTRRKICQLSAPHVRMIETAREQGASAKYCGSGGAIIGVYRDEEMFQQLEQALGQINCGVIKPTLM